MRSCQVLGLHLWFAVLQGVALLLFTRGFLLTRVELPFTSRCEALPYRESPSIGADGCTKPAFSKLVILVVDALRWDFAAPNGTAAGPGSAVGQLPALHRALERDDASAVLLKFVADPPTTTQQRLKGLLTGGLPTFMDVGNSFGAKQMQEDNLISQLASQGRRIHFSGDDTWDDLFPSDVFHTSVPYPSFNVKDLDTVDNGVQEHFIPALRNPSEWDVLIGHGLGVDHAGHIFGVDSAAMRAKLAQTDDLIREVLSIIDAAGDPKGAHHDTLLVVMGDHGQTMHGDHGGGTPEETDSALFVYTPRPQQPGVSPAAVSEVFQKHEGSGEWCPECSGTMPQVDFAPTIAALLGVPIPFGSIGHVSSALWALTRPTASRGWFDRLVHPFRTESAATPAEQGSSSFMRAWLLTYRDVLRTNAWQVQRYLKTYAQNGGALSRAALHRLDGLWQHAETLVATQQGATSAELAVVAYKEYLAATATLARNEWTQFSETEMAIGLALMVLVALVQVYLVCRADVWGAPLAHAQRQSLVGAALGGVTGSLVYVLLGSEGAFVARVRDALGSSAALGCAAFTSVCVFLLEYEPEAQRRRGILSLSLLDATALCFAVLHAASLTSNSMIEMEGTVLHFMIVTLTLLLLRAALRKQANTGRAAACVAMLLIARSLQGLNHGFAACGGLASRVFTYAPLTVFLYLIGGYSSGLGVGARALLMAQYLAIGAHWALLGGIGGHHGGEEDAAAAPQQHDTGDAAYVLAHVTLPRAVYALALCGVVRAVGELAVRCWLRGVLPQSATAVASSAKMREKKGKATGEAIARADDDGLMAAQPKLLGLIGAVGGVVMMMLGPESGSSLMLLAAAQVYLHLHVSGSRWLTVVMWRMYAAQLFFASGHACRFNALHFNAAMIGFHEFSFYVQGMLLALDTWGFDLLLLLALPLTCRRDKAALSRQFAAYGLLKLAPVVVTMGFVAVERRHLMVWALFAPKYMFEGCGLLLNNALLLGVAALALSLAN